MDFALMTEPQMGGTFDDLAAAATWAEDHGFVTFARSDHYYWTGDARRDATDAWITLGGLALLTSRIRLCVLVTPVTFRHPAVIAKSAATVDQMSGGRLDLGVGTGWMEAEHEAFGLPFPPRAERFERLQEAVRYLEEAFADGERTFEGSYYRYSGDARPKPAGVRLVIGGSGKRQTPALAGAHADEYNSFTGPPAELAPKVAAMRRAAEEAGRDPAAVTVSVMGQIHAGVDAAAYRETLRRDAAWRGIDESQLRQRVESSGAPHGTPDQVGEALAALAAVGVEKYYLQRLDVTDLEGLEAVWAAVEAAR